MAEAKNAVRLKYEQICKDCGSSQFVEDHAQGDLVCTNCGLVAESRQIDERSEWRTFGDKDGGTGADPNRVGGPINHLLSNDLSTDIGQGSGTSTMAQNLRRTALQSGADPDKGLTAAFKKIRLLCDSLGLLKNFYDTACEVYKKAAEAGVVKGRAVASIVPAVVFLACRMEAAPRTFKEILEVVHDTTKKDVARSFKLITTRLDDGEFKPKAHVKDYMRRFCNQLGLKHRDIVIAEDFSLAVSPVDGMRPDGGTRGWDGRSPLTIAAAVILITTRLPKATLMPTIDNIAVVTGITEFTIRSTVSLMLPYLEELVPPQVASGDDVRKLVVKMHESI